MIIELLSDISSIIKDRAVVAEVNGETWDLCKPLKESCELELYHFKEVSEENILVNYVFKNI